MDIFKEILEDVSYVCDLQSNEKESSGNAILC